jgi:hypothetical protein
MAESCPHLTMTWGKYDATQMELDLKDRYGVEVDLQDSQLASLTQRLHDLLPPATFAFLQTLCEPVFSRLRPEIVTVEPMVRQLETALARSLEVCSRSADMEPDKLFEPLAGSLVAMMRDVVSQPSKVVEYARLKAAEEALAGERGAARKAKLAAKEAKRALAASKKAARLQRQEGAHAGIACGRGADETR